MLCLDRLRYHNEQQNLTQIADEKGEIMNEDNLSDKPEKCPTKAWALHE